MSLPGFELLYADVADSLQCPEDAVVAAFHWYLVSSGLKCYRAGGTWPPNWPESRLEVDAVNASAASKGSEHLPARWNQDRKLTVLTYVEPTSGQLFLVKATKQDGEVQLHLLGPYGEKNSIIRTEDYVNNDLSTAARAFRSLGKLNSVFGAELAPGLQDYSHPIFQPNNNNLPQGDWQSSFIEGDTREFDSRFFWESLVPNNPLGEENNSCGNLGHSDLDPVWGGQTSGMYMDPRGLTLPSSFRPSGPGGLDPVGFPHESVPPSARFDPLGPLGVESEPDADHIKKPNVPEDII